MSSGGLCIDETGGVDICSQEASPDSAPAAMARLPDASPVLSQVANSVARWGRIRTRPLMGPYAGVPDSVRPFSFSKRISPVGAGISTSDRIAASPLSAQSVYLRISKSIGSWGGQVIELFAHCETRPINLLRSAVVSSNWRPWVRIPAIAAPMFQRVSSSLVGSFGGAPILTETVPPEPVTSSLDVTSWPESHSRLKPLGRETRFRLGQY